MLRAPRRIVTLCALLVLVSGLVGCGVKTTWVDSGNQYSLKEARTALERANSAGYATKPTSDSKQLREDAMVSLRNRGGSAARAAALMTATFPASSTGVPTYVELARVDGKSALVVVEAWGMPGGKLDKERLWVLDSSTGQIIDSAAVQ